MYYNNEDFQFECAKITYIYAYHDRVVTLQPTISELINE